MKSVFKTVRVHKLFINIVIIMYIKVYQGETGEFILNPDNSKSR